MLKTTELHRFQRQHLRVVDRGHVTDIEGLFAVRVRTGARLAGVPGVWDGLSARLAEQGGAPAAFISLGLIAAAQQGSDEEQLVASGELVHAVASARECTRLPLIVAMDGGYGNSLNVLRLVTQLERAGASVLDLSDAVSPGSRSDALGQAAIAPADMIGKLKAALDTRVEALVAARTVSTAQEGIEAALDRCEAYLETGADLIVVDRTAGAAELAAFAERFSGRAPLIHEAPGAVPTELEGLGYTMALRPQVLLEAMQDAASRVMRTLNGPPRRASA